MLITIHIKTVNISEIAKPKLNSNTKQQEQEQKTTAETSPSRKNTHRYISTYSQIYTHTRTHK